MKNLWVKASIMAAVFAMTGCADGATEEDQPTPSQCTTNVCKNDKTLTLCNNGTPLDVDCTYGCEAGNCKQMTPACTANVCKDASTLMQCSNGVQTPIPCPFGCEGGACKPQTGSTQCSVSVCQSADVLLACTNGVQSVTPCPYGCENGACKQACTTDVCKDTGTLLMCNNGKTTEVPCSLGCNAGKCNSACTVDFCRDTQILMHCENEATIPVDCPYGCNAGACNSNVPVTNKCTNGAKQCDANGNAQECVDNEWKTTTCTNGCSNGVCNNASTCVNGTKQCDTNGNAQECVNNEWKTSPCAKGCSNGTCLICANGETQCATDGKTLQTCANGTWKNSQVCTTACSGGACTTETSCKDGAIQCNGNMSQTCTGGKWTNKTNCQYGCDKGVCQPAPAVCSGSETQCNGAYVQTCTNGQWVKASTVCANGCENGACKQAPAICSGSETQCDGAYVQTCTNGQWVKASTACKNGCENGACKPDASTHPTVGSSCDATAFEETCDSSNNIYYCDTKTSKVTSQSCATATCRIQASDKTGDCTSLCTAAQSGKTTSYYCRYFQDYGMYVAYDLVCSATTNGDYAEFLGDNYEICDGSCNETEGCTSASTGSDYFYCGDKTQNGQTLESYCKSQDANSVAVCYAQSGYTYYECAPQCTTAGKEGTACATFEEGVYQYNTICTQVDNYKVMLDASTSISDYTECTSGSCNATNTACAGNSSTCQNGTKQCDGAFVQTCTNGQWTNASTACPNGCENGACKSSGSTSEGSSTHTLGASCTSALEGDTGCDGNTLVYCDGTSYVNALGGNYTCKAYGSEYYCDEQTDYGFADCVAPCDEEDEGYPVSFSNTCNTNYNDFEIYVCERGDSGKLGTFGGYYAESFCADTTTQLLCNGASVTQKTCTTCSLSGKNASGDYVSTCR